MAFYLSRLNLGCDLKRVGCTLMRSSGLSEFRGLASTSIELTSKSSEDLKPEKSPEAEPSAASAKPSHPSELGKNSGTNVNLRFKYPEMFPEPFMIWRNPIKEKLERKDMLLRRSRIHIPEFYVGSVLRVVLSNVHQPDKTSTFVGICIQREECGLKANFILRNVVDNLGVEIKLELYDPKILKIEVLRLEKRLDNNLRYLRDAPPEYSTFPLDMKAEIRRTDEVPLNKIKVRLNPRPWTENWYRFPYKGIDDIDSQITYKMRTHPKKEKPWEKYDLMQTYRATLPEEEISDILEDIKDDIKKHEEKHKRRES